MNRFDLYEWCVQSPALQARFLRALHPGGALILREDFAGPAAIARAWVMLDGAMRAAAVDLDPEPLEHARLRLAGSAPGSAERLKLVVGDSRTISERADIIAAFNFAACELHTRPAMLEWLSNARRTLNPRGVLVCDLYGGSGAYLTGEEERAVETPAGRVVYTWEQREADPLTARVRNAIHFALPDGRAMREAFVYDWRLWGVAELREAMDEAGFTSTEIHTGYGEAIDGEGNPVPLAHEGPFDDDTFVVYVVGRAG